MNKYTLLTVTTLTLISLSSCGSSSELTPSQNKAHTGVTQATTPKDDGAMQKSLDNWLNKEWTPRVEKDEAIKKVNEDRGRSFTIQEYIDKAVVYSKEGNVSRGESHSEQMSELPVVGNAK